MGGGGLEGRGFRRYEGGGVGRTNVYGGAAGEGVEVEDTDRGVDLVDVGDGGFVEGLGVSVSSTTWMGWGSRGRVPHRGVLGRFSRDGFLCSFRGIWGVGIGRGVL